MASSKKIYEWRKPVVPSPAGEGWEGYDNDETLERAAHLCWRAITSGVSPTDVEPDLRHALWRLQRTTMRSRARGVLTAVRRVPLHITSSALVYVPETAVSAIERAMAAPLPHRWKLQEVVVKLPCDPDSAELVEGYLYVAAVASILATREGRYAMPPERRK